jgi:phage regulator Rha-like protein
MAQPGHWLGPVTGLGWLGLAQPMWAAQKNKKEQKSKKGRKNKKKCVCMNKNNVNLLVYSLTPESGIKIPV